MLLREWLSVKMEELMVKLMPLQHQMNVNDCDLFALAFATDFF